MNARLKETILRSKARYADAIMKRPDSLPDLLPYDDYFEEEGVFILKDGSLGIVYEFDLFEHEPLTEKQTIRAVRSMRSWLNLPSNCVMQFIYYQSLVSDRDHKIKELEDSYADGHPVSKFFYEKKIEALKRNCAIGSKTPVFKRRAYLSVRYFPRKTRMTKLRDYFESPEKTIKEVAREFRSELLELKGISKDLEQSQHDRLCRLDASELVDFLRRFFNPDTYYKRSFCEYNPKDSIGKQYLYNSPTLDYEGIKREGLKTKTLSLLTAPQVSYPGGMAYFTRLDFPFRISLNFSFPKKSEVKRFFDIKEFFLENSPSARSRVQKEEIEAVQERLARDDRCLYMTFNVTVDGLDSETIDSRVRSVCKVFNDELDCEVIEEDHIGLASCLNGLPLCYSPESDLSARRYIRILRSDVLNFLPIFDSSKGCKDALSFHLSREGNITPFSLLNNPINSHTAILADSGSGKSALVTDIVQSVKRLSPEPLVFIIDKKLSYKSTAKYFDGNITVFDRNGDIPFSPFRGQYDEEKIAFLEKLLMSAIALTSPSFEIESEHQTVITKALKLAYKKRKEQLGLVYEDGELSKQGTDEQVELTMDLFIAELASLNDGSASIRAAVEPILSKLKPFYGDGSYAKFFGSGAKKEGKMSSLLYIYDLDALDNDPTLQTLMTMAVIEEIRRIISLSENKGRTGFIVLEEFAMLGRNNKVFRDFALDFAETMRKRGVWLITLTPRPQNYFELSTGQAFWSVAENYLFLAMNEDNVDYIVKNSSVLTPATAQLVKSLSTVENSHADFMIVNKKKSLQQVMRFRRTAYDHWMSPTNAKDEKRLDDALSCYPDKWQALEYLVSSQKQT